MFFQLIPPNTNFNFLGHRRKFIAGSLAMMVIGVVATFVRGGPPIGIDFAGGTEVQLRFDQGVAVDESSLREVARGAGFLDATGEHERARPHEAQVLIGGTERERGIDLAQRLVGITAEQRVGAAGEAAEGGRDA